ncbi:MULTISPECIES: AraC family transcriptional regulator [Sinorhizobium]|uniref:AraC family transcriptional regulator n=1 Tax=Sinorhizobium TaxID=28105 RepID=UPI00067EE3A2|nr:MULTISPECIES: AraC family transcriptional regulator [Sinorhizobium]WOS67081.1 AraC family transcriptional regulator [Sinorhizobium fredii GR64]
MPLPLDELCEIIAKHTPTGEAAPFPKVTFRSGTTELEPFAVVLDPMLCFVIQGAKSIIIGDRVMNYGANSVLALALHLPATGRLVEGTGSKPYLAIAIDLDREMVSELLLGLPQVPAVETEAFTVSPMEVTMIEPLLRLARLADNPEDAAQLAPLSIREILYRAVKGPIGILLREFARGDGRTAQVRLAVDWILTMNEHASIDRLASIAGMSVTSGFLLPSER